MRYEVKIGLLAIVAIAVAFWGYKYIQGSNILSNSNYYHAIYDDVGGLTVGTPVTISGVTVGSVNEIILDQVKRKVKVTFDIQGGINIPKETDAYIATVSLLGEKAVVLEYSTPCFGGKDCAPEGSELNGYTKGILASFTGGGGKGEESPLDGMKDQLGATLDSLEYKFFSPESDNPIARSTNDLAVTMENLKASTARLQRIMDQNAGEINTTFDNLAGLTNTLATKQESIAGLIDNAENFTGDLSKLDLDKTMVEVNQAIASLKTTLNEADKAMGGVNSVMNKVNSGQGTLGKLLTDDKIYDRLNSATMAADTLFSDFQEKPYRYIPFKSRKRVLKHDRKDAALEEEQNEGNNK
ncbi:MCE family protein [Neolewinella aurantiaca]|uniref:MCE family protein n=1 Tax=Neolewinella aurantiaca TaxID=2602767 RepID=A0A5C7FVT6_9BACT|nr:MlaD family protein [Neolewinella aurantiaca]TXF89707.1 MCE family protein [Neolewinella aurantiaca]